MKTPPPLHQKTPEGDAKSKPRSAGSITLVIGLATILAALVSGLAQFVGNEAGVWSRMVLPLVTAVLAFLAMFSGMISFFRGPDCKHRRTVLGVAAGGVGLVLLGLIVVTKRVIEIGSMVSSVEWSGEVEEEILVEPLEVMEETITAQDFRDAWAAWLGEHVVDDVKSRLKEGEKSQLVGEVLDGFVADWTYAADRPSREEWNGLAARLGDYWGPGAPTAKLIAAGFSERSINVIGMNSVTRNLRKQETNPFVLYYLELQRGEQMGRTSNSEEMRDCYRNAIDALDKMLESGWFDGENTWLLADLTEIGHFANLEKEQGDALMEVYSSHDLPDWFLHYVRGKQSIREAWKARGSGYSNSVSSEGWKGFEDHLKEAKDELGKSWELAPEYPFAAIEMIQVEMGIGNEPVQDMRLWLDRALSASCDSWPAIDAWFWGMRPRWHGNRKAILQMGEHCLATGRFDTGLPRMYLNALKEISSDGDSDIYGEPGVYESIHDMVEGYLAAGPPQKEEQFWRTTRVIMAMRNDRFDEVRKDWLALDGEFSEDVLASWNHDSLALYFRSRIGKGSEMIAEATELEAEGAYGEAAGIYRKEMEHGNWDPEQKEFLGNWIALLELQQRYEDGEQVDLLRDGPDFWRKVEGDYRRNSKGEMVITSSTTRFAIEHFLRVGQDFEAIAEIATPGKALRDGGAGLHFTYRTFAGKQWSTCYVKDLYSGVRKCKIAPYRYAAYLDETIPVSEETAIQLTCHDERWRVAVNGEPLHKGTVAVKSDYLSRNSRLCLGGWSSFPVDKFAMTYRSVRVRKLEPLEGAEE
jgi:hypothetical protein